MWKQNGEKHFIVINTLEKNISKLPVKSKCSKVIKFYLPRNRFLIFTLEMEKTEDVKMTDKDSSPKEGNEQRDDKAEDLKDEDSERDTSASGDNKQEGTSVKSASSEDCPKFEENQNDSTITENSAKNKQAVADSGNSEKENLESQTNKTEDSGNV